MESIPEVETIMPPGRALIPILPTSESPPPIPGQVEESVPAASTEDVNELVALFGDVTDEDVLRARDESRSKPSDARLKQVYLALALKYRDTKGPTAYAELLGLPSFAPAATNAGRSVVLNTSRVPKDAVKRISIRDDGWCFYRAALLGARYSGYGTPEEYAALSAPPTPEVLESLRTFVKQIQARIQVELAIGNKLIEYHRSMFQVVYSNGYPYQGELKYMTFEEYVDNLTEEDNGMPRMYPDTGFGVGLAAALVLKRNIRMVTENLTRYTAVETYLADPPTREPTVLILKEREQAHFDLLVPDLEYRGGGKRARTFKRGHKLRMAKYTRRQQ